MSERFEVPKPSAEAIRAARAVGLNGNLMGSMNDQAKAILAIDLPRVVETEVRAALNALAPWFVPDQESRKRWYAERAAYLSARFPSGGEPEKESEPQPAQCPQCHKWFVLHSANVGFGCLVAHSPGLCCHFHDTEVPAPSGGETGEAHTYTATATNTCNVATLKDGYAVGCVLASGHVGQHEFRSVTPSAPRAPTDAEGFVTRVHADNLISVAERQTLQRLEQALPFIEALAVFQVHGVNTTQRDAAARAFLAEGR